ncbi:MAG: hypothetical protein M3Z96_00700 [Pseudomonadota bacterium]|nr:hypothetical protein [Pseudomonadota bacterium]
MTWPAVVCWILILLGVLPRSPLPLLYLCFGFEGIQSLTLLPTAVDGSGLNLIPQAPCAVFLVCKILLSEGRLPRAVDAAMDPAKLGLLFIFLAYALFSAYVMPRFFAHMVEVIPMNATVSWKVLLQPTSSNIAQSAYMTLSVGVVLAFSLAGESASFRRHFMQASLVGGLVLIATGLADLAAAAAGLGGLLEPFRNANYALLADAELGGSKRVVGLMPEASAFGPACVAAAAILAFLRPCFEKLAWRDYLAPLTIAGLLAMAVLSISSTAFGGLAVFAAVYAANWLRRALSPDAPARDGLKWEAIAALAAVLVILGVVALTPDIMNPVYERIDEVIFKKSETSSYEGRMMWTKVAMHAFFATDGLGVGLGSARTSDWFVAVLSNTGIFPAALLFGFILRLYFRRCRAADPRAAEFATALKFGLVPWFAMAAVSWPAPDVGAGVASVLGLISCLTSTDVTSSIRFGVAVGRQIRARSRP